MMRTPPKSVEAVRGSLLNSAGSSWSMMATMKIVSSAATDESTGDVKLMRIKKDPEKTMWLATSDTTR
jgi:hypothetical protein